MSRTVPTEPAATAAEHVALCQQIVRIVPCGHCWHPPGQACTPDGDHLARWLRAERRGLITRAELAAAVATLDVIAAHAVITERAA